MSESTHTHHEQGSHQKDVHHDHRPYWKRAHRDWRFWVAVFFIGAALFIYVTTVDLSLVPNKHPHSVPVGQ
ncbi:hypothetical protein HNQ77_001713 [Silvibacterium bohemicum]|uniref:Uncharacterized protein n=1 Tax=Silvibacterium bohemicum TaxID=1577686 RepID=A0A841K0I9_9BACT|nr:hypothetical protein [Silvibacterium bohemicum]MBB6143764.1 hypothetical protein [Silvibacterium bohemicum]